MLNGWKAIAAYLGREERTAMRWAVERGLPVHRAPGRGRGTVYAFAEEVDAWLAAARQSSTSVPTLVEQTAPLLVVDRPTPWHRRRATVTAALALGVLLAAFGAWSLLGRGAVAADRGAVTFSDPAAKASYLEATYDWNQRTGDSLKRAVREYGDAIARDPRVPASYVGLANSYLLLREFGSLPDADAYPRAAAAAEAALRLDGKDAAAHRALAFIAFWWRQDRTAARREFTRAIALAPADPLTRHWYATALSANGEPAAALREIGRARDLDPTSTSVIADQGLISYIAGRRDEARELLRRLERQQPDAVAPHRYLAAIALLEGRSAEWLDEQAASDRLRGDVADAAALARWRPLGTRPDAIRAALLAHAQATAGPGHWFALAAAASLAGRRDVALDALGRACATHEPGAVSASGDLWLSRSVSRAEVAALCGEEALD